MRITQTGALGGRTATGPLRAGGHSGALAQSPPTGGNSAQTEGDPAAATLWLFPELGMTEYTSRAMTSPLPASLLGAMHGNFGATVGVLGIG